MSFFNYGEEKRFVESIKLIGIQCSRQLEKKIKKHKKKAKKAKKESKRKDEPILSDHSTNGEQAEAPRKKKRRKTTNSDPLTKHGYLLIRAVESLAMAFLYDDADAIEDVVSSQNTYESQKVKHMTEVKKEKISIVVPDSDDEEEEEEEELPPPDRSTKEQQMNYEEINNETKLHDMLQYIIQINHLTLRKSISQEEFTYFKACWHILIVYQLHLAIRILNLNVNDINQVLDPEAGKERKQLLISFKKQMMESFGAAVILFTELREVQMLQQEQLQIEAERAAHESTEAARKHKKKKAQKQKPQQQKGELNVTTLIDKMTELCYLRTNHCYSQDVVQYDFEQIQEGKDTYAIPITIKLVAKEPPIHTFIYPLPLPWQINRLLTQQMRAEVMFFDMIHPKGGNNVSTSWHEPISISREISCQLSPLQRRKISVEDIPRLDVTNNPITSVKRLSSREESSILVPLMNEQYYNDYFTSYIYAHWLERASHLVQAYVYYCRAADGLHKTDPKRTIALYRAALCCYHAFYDDKPSHGLTINVPSSLSAAEDHRLKQMLSLLGGNGMLILHQSYGERSLDEKIIYLYRQARSSERLTARSVLLSRLNYITTLGQRVQQIYRMNLSSTSNAPIGRPQLKRENSAKKLVRPSAHDPKGLIDPPTPRDSSAKSFIRQYATRQWVFNLPGWFPKWSSLVLLGTFRKPQALESDNAYAVLYLHMGHLLAVIFLAIILCWWLL